MTTKEVRVAMERHRWTNRHPALWFAVALVLTGFSLTALRGQTPVRDAWSVGTNHPAGTLPVEVTYSEFSGQNNADDPPPGRVTRLPGDPLYSSTANPGPDDDYYFGGVYGAGFNGLTSGLVVPNDEPWKAWERSLTMGDRTNRMHFLLSGSQAGSASSLRLSFEFTTGGSAIGTSVQPGFSEHDLVVRFRNGSGIGTVLYSGRISSPTNVVLSFTAGSVSATAGANSIEFVRIGPTSPAISYWLTFDYVLLEAPASSGSNFSIDAGVIAGGGGISGATGMILMGTIGEPGAGMSMMGARFAGNPGFWFVIGGMDRAGVGSFTIPAQVAATAFGTDAGDETSGFGDGAGVAPDVAFESNGLNRVTIAGVDADIEITFVGSPMASYQIQFTTDSAHLSRWQDFSPPAVRTAGNDGTVTFVDVHPTGSFRLYRARRIP